MSGDLWRTLWGAARLKAPAIRRWQAQGGVGWSLGLFFAVWSIVGLVGAAAATHAQFLAPPVWQRQEQAAASLAGWLERSPLPPDVPRTLGRTVVAWLDLEAELAGLPRPLGRPASTVVGGLQEAVAAPYRRLAAWLPYTLLVLGVARALGGRATLQGMVAAAGLSALPHLLQALAPLPGVGPLFSLLAGVWGAAVYVKATAVAHDLDLARALLAVALPALAALTAALGLVAVALNLCSFGLTT